MPLSSSVWICAFVAIPRPPRDSSNLVPGDIGRSVSLLNSFVLGLRVEELAAKVIEELTPIEKEVLCTDQRWYTLHVLPYRTLDHSIKGAMIVLVDIDIRKRTTDLSRDVAEYASRFLSIINQPLIIINQPLIIIDRSLQVLWCNDVFQATFPGFSAAPEGNTGPTIGTGQWAEPTLMSHINDVLTTGIQFKDLEIRFASSDTDEKAFKVSGSRFPTTRNEAAVMLSFEEDIPPGT
jgi:two-component system CheB/CheR fusion protein